MSILASLFGAIGLLRTHPPATMNLAGRAATAKDTLERTEAIVAATPGASLDSEFLRDTDLPPLPRDDAPGHAPAPVRIVNSDSFTFARKLLKEFPGSKISVLNLANDEYVAGGWLQSLSRTQEEALCYSSTLYKTLREEWYPWRPSVAGIYSPAVVVFKDDLDHNCVDLPENERVVVSVLTLAAPRWPRLTPDRARFARDEDIENLRGKTRLMLRMAAHRKQDIVILGAFGCGAFACPPRFVAEEMRNILLEDEFKGWFKLVTFAVFSKKEPDFLGADNFDIFSEVFKDVTV
ncbi:hypothetical protein AURDEDRAFT_101888 [Auricularia subglabra TFB-10046 SS5]|nr:hypothetical protein AURDEDRAFT_101888 [Auricularia subglabra TFB-10046 SS5]